MDIRRYELRVIWAMGVIGQTSGHRLASFVGVGFRGLWVYSVVWVRRGYIRRNDFRITLYKLTDSGRLEWERLNSLGVFEGMERECELARERLARRQAKKGIRSIPSDRSTDNDLGV